MSHSDQNRPSANTRSKRCLSVDSVSADNFPIKFLGETTQELKLTKHRSRRDLGTNFKGSQEQLKNKKESVSKTIKLFKRIQTSEVEHEQETAVLNRSFSETELKILGDFAEEVSSSFKLDNNISDIVKNKLKAFELKFEMAEMEITDIITMIPVFEGHQKDLDYFISTCTTLEAMVKANQKPMFNSIVKAKLKGIALTKMQPLNTLASWDDLKKRLEEKFRKPLTYEIAQDEISHIRQSRTESIDSYGNTMRLALHKLNKASETLSNEEAARRLLREANEKLAVRKFEQGLYNHNLKLCVGARDFTTLDAAISYALQKENLYRIESRPRCNYCKNVGHSERECRQKQRNNDDRNRYKTSPNKYGGNTGNYNNRNGNSSNRWESNGRNIGRENNERLSNRPGDPGNFRNSNSQNKMNTPQNMRNITEREHTITLGEALKGEAKN